jgi:pimeloyl-ACP methyl ester carboxylesterase
MGRRRMARRSRTNASGVDRPSSWWAAVSTTARRNAPLAWELAEHFTVYNYARRGRGESGDTPPYAVEREIEDIEALITEAGGSAHLYGVSSGGALVPEAAAAGIGVDKPAVYEVPCAVAGDMPRQEFVEQLGPVLAEGRPGDALELFMRTMGSSDEDIAAAKNAPFWSSLQAIEHTIAYDAACMANYQPPTARLATITRPTLVITGGVSPASQPGMGGRPTSSSRRPTRSPRASHTRNVRPLEAKDTWPS